MGLISAVGLITRIRQHRNGRCRSGAPSKPGGLEKWSKQGECCGKPLKINRHGRQERLDAHILQTPADRSGEPMPALRLAMEPLRPPTVALVEPSILFGPSLSATTRPQQGRMIVAHDHGLVHATWRQAVTSHRAAVTLLGFGVEETPVFNAPGRSQNSPLGALQDIVPSVVAKLAQGHPAADRLLLRRGITGSIPRRSSAP